MADNPGSGYPVQFHEVLSQLNSAVDRCLLKIPVFAVCVLVSFVSYAHFNGHAVGISGHAVQAAALAGLSAAAYSPTVTGFRVRVILPDFSLETDVKISTGLCRAALIIIVDIVLCGTCCTYIVDNNVLNSSAAWACVVCSEVRVLVNFQVAHSSLCCLVVFRQIIFVDNTQDFAHILCICCISACLYDSDSFRRIRFSFQACITLFAAIHGAQ